MTAKLLNWPITRFAAVEDVKYASSNELDTVPYFAPGGVLLSELAPGEFGMVITGHSYSVTIVAVTITGDWKIASDSDRLEVRMSPWRREEQLYGQTWLYLRFKNSLVYLDFNRVLWDTVWQLQTKAKMLQARLDDVAYAQPSNFTKYCRQYLGEDYFDQLTDSGGSESDSEEDRIHDNSSLPAWDDGNGGSGSEAEGSGSEAGRSGSEATAVDVY
ncbi:hypothetical protein GSI_04446 [Ganoderma sinense ZZ0214-1]|uniref:Uncharacterized protein n=1 Tax=Ganoderma sinense ZZ0214-1 TaxID=1077348 RepID=A0A2G8SJ94_9APHY|nr:hypothetical protein GSI_04446 [Ganoderma sinense ZZ0214-1]